MRAISADSFTGRAWSASLQDDYDHANRSRGLAIAGYALASVGLVAAAVIVLRTAPADKIERKLLALPSVTPTRGGAVAGMGWRF